MWSSLAFLFLIRSPIVRADNMDWLLKHSPTARKSYKCSTHFSMPGPCIITQYEPHHVKVTPGALVKMQRILNRNEWWIHTSVANHAHNICTRTHAKTCLISQILNTIEVYGKIYLCGIKYIKNAETFRRPWHIVQEGMRTHKFWT